jgi:NAD(P)-dependent dehydrogenase (short-subunit alcohol dehydrogenase family)
MTTALVTGANRGIGLSLVQHLTRRGDTVIACCRTPSEALEATGARIERLEVTDGEQIDALAERLGDTTLDLLIHNAGILRRNQLGQLDVDTIRQQFEVNALGPLRLTDGLRRHLKRGSKVGIVTSRMGSIGDNTSGGAYGYRMSKAAVNAAGRSLAHDLKDQGVAVILLHPGWVQTDMTAGRGNWGPDEAAAGLLARLDELDLDHTGTFRHASGEALPW